ncbi:MAG TPA: NADH-quinone oxidoreductase subunit N [Gemmataceae bacterium]|nr:NADH-quinone oxidoreductase subunit N [Gemmataceae bacterium]
MFPSPAFVSDLSEHLQRDVIAFLPELVLCCTIVGMLLVRLVVAPGRSHLAVFALVMSALALAASVVFFWPGTSASFGAIIPETGGAAGFYGLLIFDTFGLYLRIFLLAFLCLSLWLSLVTGIPDREDSADYATLLVGGILGMMLMVSSNHLLMAFIAIEMASVPSYVLAGFLKGRRQGSEAALKYVVYGASASGVMLYGISLMTGVYGTGSLSEIAKAVGTGQNSLPLPVVAGAVCVLVGLGFKLSAVPFHFWCPDVFEGAAAEVGAFLSVASKSAALGLTARFLFTLGTPTNDGHGEAASTVIGLVWGLFAAITATFGNLAALAQTNVKRLLAYSTIAHAGIMMMALLPIGPRMVGPLLYYISAYLMMNLGAFAVVALVRNRTGSEDIDAYRGLIWRSPGLAVGMAFFLLSLLGLPPLAGFAAKFQVFVTLYDTGRAAGREDAYFGWYYFGLLVVAALNTAVSAGYYLKIVRAMTLEDPPEGAGPISVPAGGRVLVALLAGMVIAAGVLWDPLTRAADRAARSFAGPTVVTESHR